MRNPLPTLFACLALGACGQAVASCPQGMQDAALERLAPSLGYGPSDVSVSLGQDNAQSLDNLEAKVRATRRRVAKITDPCSRAAYNGWLDWYETQIADGRSELRDHHQKREMDEYYAQQKRDAATARAAHIKAIP